MLRRLHPDQPASFAFTPANQKWAETQITKYPEGRQASAIIPLLWRAQEQEGWLSRPAIEHVSEMLGLAYIRGLEVATFYFMFQLQPVGSVAHIQVCGTTSCMICGAEDLMAVCKDRIASRAHEVSADGKFSWEEVECLGACSNAPMAQIGKDYYEDLTTERLSEIIDELAAGKVPVPGPQNGRFASEPLSGLTSLSEHESGRTQYNASAQLAVDIGDTVKRIDGTEVPLTAPWQTSGADDDQNPPMDGPLGPDAGSSVAGDDAIDAVDGVERERGDSSDQYSETPGEAPEGTATGKPEHDETTDVAGHPAPRAKKLAAEPGTKPSGLKAARATGADNLKLIKGVGPKLETMLNDMGFYHYDQIGNWGEGEIAWVDQNLQGFKGRASRDNWVSQAQSFTAGAGKKTDEDAD
ncbi:NADH dehydrogenase subunit E [Sulfitobacter brevis]|uniref:NADH dehydrogenase subunit E n=1 Tax=Sulfitobacter brevis TaxID=74348 RepID=A0A1I2CCX2_9RHOB|nr:NADH-quinone oxidoreductase subunit E [Sulfitobacter brevis]SFE65663.1 NADH dehydrogenase subunit E [Sulfitobacter brevis]